MKCKQLFENPPIKYKPRKIHHEFSDDIDAELDSILSLGYGGVVTNIPRADGFCKNPENIKKAERIFKILREKNVPYMIYDENGYPSGRAGGWALENHPELEAKGLFAYKRYCFCDTVATYILPEDADEIVFASAYPFGDVSKKGQIDYSSCREIPHTKDKVSCQLKAGEVLYVFAVKTTHEGTHSMHNACSQMKNINIMNPEATERFIDVAYKPLAKIAGALENAEAVFTDEPSLFFTYSKRGEVYPYAFLPYSPALFSEYEKKYGERLEPRLPLLYEGAKEGYCLRIKFYELVGELCAKAYSGLLNTFCKKHGTQISGHYLSEENINGHVQFYGNLISVLCSAGIPGFDNLPCHPEIYRFLDAKLPALAKRKMGADRMMVELCPYDGYSEFIKHPYDNMFCTAALCFMHGARIACSYFSVSDKYNAGLAADGITADQRALMRSFNEYLGRISYLLDGASEDCNVLIYYPLEDIQARQIPTHSADTRDTASGTRDSVEALAGSIINAGFNFHFADKDELIKAAASSEKRGGDRVKFLIVPSCTVISEDTLKAISLLSAAGVKVYYHNSLPSYAVSSTSNKLSADCLLRAENPDKATLAKTSDTYISPEITGGEDGIIRALREIGGVFSEKTEKRIIRAKFTIAPLDIAPSRTELYMLVNMSREDGEITFNSKKDGLILNPETAKISKINPSERLTVPKLRALFVLV